jgi:hypothetical protein
MDMIKIVDIATVWIYPDRVVLQSHSFIHNPFLDESFPKIYIFFRYFGSFNFRNYDSNLGNNHGWWLGEDLLAGH